MFISRKLWKCIDAQRKDGNKMTKNKAHNNPEAFKKALASFTKEWLGYEFCVIYGSDFSLETTIKQDCIQETKISFTISGNAKRKFSKAKTKYGNGNFAF